MAILVLCSCGTPPPPSVEPLVDDPLTLMQLEYDRMCKSVEMFNDAYLKSLAKQGKPIDTAIENLEMVKRSREQFAEAMKMMVSIR